MRVWGVLAAIGLMISLAAIYLPNVELLDTPSRLFGWIVPSGLRGLLLFIAVPLVLALTLAIARLLDSRPRQFGRIWLFRVLFLGALLFAAVVVLIRLVLELSSVQGWLSVLLFLSFLAAIAFAFIHETSLPTAAGIIIIGVAATSLGLYGASKLSVESKMALAEPQVSATLEQQDGQSALRIVAAASNMRDRRLQITVWGQPRVGYIDPRALAEPYTVLWKGVLEPGDLDDINSTIAVPLALPRWDRLVIEHCKLMQPGGRPVRPGEMQCKDNDEQRTTLDTRGTVLDTRNTIGRAETTGYIVANSAKSLQVMVSGRYIPPGDRLEVELCRVRKRAHAKQLAFATLTADASGALTWKALVPAGLNGDALVLQYRQCRRGCPAGWTPLARYTLP